MDPCGRLSGEAGCAPCFSPDGRRWLDLDSGSRSAPDRAAGGKRRVPGQGARGCDGLGVPSLLPDLAGDGRAQSLEGEGGMGVGGGMGIERARGERAREV